MNAITSEEFRALVGRFATGLTVVTTSDHGQIFGTTASAMTSVSLDPPTLLVCMNKTSVTGQAITRSGHFVVNILSDEQADVAMHFAGKASAFDGHSVTTGKRGSPIFVDALAVFECRVSAEITAGTHSIVVGEVEFGHGGDGKPLAYYQGKLGRLAFDDSVQ